MLGDLIEQNWKMGETILSGKVWNRRLGRPGPGFCCALSCNWDSQAGDTPIYATTQSLKHIIRRYWKKKCETFWSMQTDNGNPKEKAHLLLNMRLFFWQVSGRFS
jgi:hypothetical protein